MTEQLLSLEEYTTIANKIVSNAKIGFPVSDDLIYEIVKAMAISDTKKPDEKRSKMTKEQLRRQNAIFAIRRYIYSHKKKKRDNCVSHCGDWFFVDNQEPVHILTRQEERQEREEYINSVLAKLSKTPLKEEEREEIAARTGLPRKRVDVFLKQLTSVYNTVKGD